MKVFKRLTVLALVLVMVAGLFPARSTQAAAKPAKAKVTAKANDDGKSVTLTIAKTKNAEGYKIMVKKPGAKKFTKLATIKEDGTAARTYTAKKLTEGEYQFKVRAYLKNGSKTVWGKYSKVAKVTIKSKADDDKSDETGKEDSSSVKYISTMEELKNIDAKNTALRYILKNDIDMKGWKEPIEKMCCTLDGAGHTLKNLSVPFVAMLSGGTIENVTFDLSITSFYKHPVYEYQIAAPIAFLVGGNNLEIGTVRSCKVTGSINCVGKELSKLDPYAYYESDSSQEIYVGGLVGCNPNNLGYIEKCVNEADITITGYPNAVIGGIVGIAGAGSHRVVVSECKNAGDITSDTTRIYQASWGAGGICGSQSGHTVLKDCLNTGSVHLTDPRDDYPRSGGGISGVTTQPYLENCVSIGDAGCALFGDNHTAQNFEIWSSAGYKTFVNVYYKASIGDIFIWNGSPADLEGQKAVSDITDKSAFKGLDFDKIWFMTDNGPDLRNIAK